MKKIVTVTAKDLMANFLSYLFWPFIKSKNSIKFPSSWWSANEKYFCFLFIANHTLLQRYINIKINRVLLHVIPACSIVPCCHEGGFCDKNFFLICSCIHLIDHIKFSSVTLIHRCLSSSEPDTVIPSNAT